MSAMSKRAVRVQAAVLIAVTASLAQSMLVQAAGHLPPPRQIPAQGCCSSGNGWAPGEPSVAVGASKVVETVNSSFTVYSKLSPYTKLFHTDLTTFFGGGSVACVDPRVIYLPANARFALVCSDIGSSPARVRFAVSATSDPAGAWHKYSAASGFLDQPKILATSDKIIVAGNGNY